MLPSAKLLLSLGGAFALLAVVLGAFGAHALKERVAPELLAVYQTAVQYHFYHALGLLAVGLAANQVPESGFLKWSGALMVAGIVLFSGSLYLLALTGVRGLGALAPAGGVAFIAAWACFVWAVVSGV